MSKSSTKGERDASASSPPSHGGYNPRAAYASLSARLGQRRQGGDDATRDSLAATSKSQADAREKSFAGWIAPTTVKAERDGAPLKRPASTLPLPTRSGVIQGMPPTRAVSTAQPTAASSGTAKRARATTQYNSAKYSDVTVIIGGEKIKAHRVILDNCELFERMLAQSGDDAVLVNLDTSEARPVVVKGLLRFLYHGRYDIDEIGEVPAPEWDILSLHTEVYILASKYDMVDLQVATAAFHRAWDRPWDNLPDFCRILRLLWSTTILDQQSLRQHFAGLCLWQMKQLAQYAPFIELLHKTDLGKDIALTMVSGERGERRSFFRCSCGRLFDCRGKIQCIDCGRANNDKGNTTRTDLLPQEWWVRVRGA